MNNPKKQRNIQILILFVLLGTILFSIIIFKDYDLSPNSTYSDILSDFFETLFLSFSICGMIGLFFSLFIIKNKIYRKRIFWLLLFIIFPWKYRGGCLAATSYIGYNCPEWEFFGGLMYSLEFISHLIKSLSGDWDYLIYASELFLPIIFMLIISYIISSIIILIISILIK